MPTLSPAGADALAANYPVVTAQQFEHEILTDPSAYILDVRTPEEYAEGHIANAHNLDWLNKEAFAAGAKLLPHDRTLYVYCRSGRRSAEASDYLTEKGFNVVDLEGGYEAWLQR